jgi:dCMP deaminase
MLTNTHQRPSWDEYFMQVARTVAQRGTCDRGRSGSIIVKEKRILTTGYVGSPPGMPHCDEVGHQMAKYLDEAGQESEHCIRTIHAEQNAICQAARFGISLEGSTLYCKMEPCYVCARMVIAVGVKRVVCEKRYQRAELTREMFNDAGIALEVLEDEVEDYAK